MTGRCVFCMANCVYRYLKQLHAFTLIGLKNIGLINLQTGKMSASENGHQHGGAKTCVGMSKRCTIQLYFVLETVASLCLTKPRAQLLIRPLSVFNHLQRKLLLSNVTRYVRKAAKFQKHNTTINNTESKPERISFV